MTKDEKLEHALLSMRQVLELSQDRERFVMLGARGWAKAEGILEDALARIEDAKPPGSKESEEAWTDEWIAKMAEERQLSDGMFVSLAREVLDCRSALRRIRAAAEAPLLTAPVDIANFVVAELEGFRKFTEEVIARVEAFAPMARRGRQRIRRV